MSELLEKIKAHINILGKEEESLLVALEVIKEIKERLQLQTLVLQKAAIINPQVNKYREARLKAKLSKIALSRLAGVNVATIALVERGATNPTSLTIKKLSIALGLSIK